MDDFGLWEELLQSPRSSLGLRTLTPIEEWWPLPSFPHDLGNDYNDYYLEDRAPSDDPLLAANREYQAVLVQELGRLDVCLEEGRQLAVDLQTALTAMQQQQHHLLGRSSLQLNRMPREIAEELRHPPLPFLLESAEEWTPKEEEQLRQAIIQTNQRRIMARLLLEHQEHEGSAERLQRIQEQVRSLCPADLLRINPEAEDWEGLPERALLKRRSEAACRQHWFHQLHPQASLAPWTEGEEQTLRDWVRLHGLHGRWGEAVPGRTAFQALSHYQRKFNQTLLRGKWTAEEDAALRRLTEQLGRGRWGDVAEGMGGLRTPAQCSHRYGKTLDPTIKRGKWSAQEDALLQAAVSLHGQRDWWLVASYVPGRTDVQCRERHVNVLSGGVERGQWTPEEDAILREAVERLGLGRWSEISQTRLPRRTDNQCWRRWKLLSKLQGGQAPKPRKPRGPKAAPLPPELRRPRGRPRKRPLPEPVAPKIADSERRKSRRLLDKTNQDDREQIQ